jgi:putative ABC transport system permease protein
MNDFRYAIRAFLQTPGFTLVAVLTLGLGIGATTAIFSVVNAVLLRPLPYTAADRLVTTRGSLPDLQDLESSSGSFDGLAVWASNLYNLRTGTDRHQVLGGTVSASLLPLLGVQPVLGRNFTADDERHPTVILSDALWRTRFASNPAVLGQPIDLGGTAYTVVGVAPAWFRFPSADFELWTPLRLIEQQAPKQAVNRAFRIFSAVARLKNGVTLQQAQSESAAISARLAREFPATNEGTTMTFMPLYDRLVEGARPALRVLLGAVGLVLLIACANVANLMLARTTVREREFAIRVALGAGRGRLVRQLITESLTLASAGGLLGLLVTMWGVDALPAVLEARLPRADGIRIDRVVLAFSMLATLLTGIVFGLAPALQAASGASGSLKDGGRGVAGSPRGRRVRRTIVILETALAVVVLVGAGLLVRSFLALTARDAGFVPGHLLSFNVQLVQFPDDASRAQAARQLIEKISQLRGVEAAGAATGLAAVTPQRSTRFAIDGRTLTAGEDSALFMAATPGYFKALQTPVLQGRALDSEDVAGGAPVAVVNRALARQLFADGEAIGHRLRIINPEQSPGWRTIVGVVGDVSYQGLEETPRPALYTPYAQTPFLWLYVMVRTPAGVESSPSIIQALSAVVPAVHPLLIPANVRTMADVLAQNVAEPRFNMLLLSSFAALALLLSSIGIYGVIAYSVAQRAHEIGVRMALGACGRDVLRLIVAEGLGVAAAGVALGLAGAAILTKVMAGLLYGVTARDPLAFAAGGALLLAVGLAATYVPARRATRVEPVVALRRE